MIFGERLKILRPDRVKEALTLLRDEGPLIPLAGGTDLYVTLNAGQMPTQPRYLDLWHLGELRGIRVDGRTLRFGALTTYTDCIAHKGVGKLLPILLDAARQIGGVQIQNRGTLAGNIANGSPAADAVPVLMAAGAKVVLRSASDGEREVPLSEYYTGYRQSVRAAEELIVGITVKVPRGPQHFRKVGTRAAQAISKVVVARVGDGIAWGSVGPTITRSRRLETYLAQGGSDLAAARAEALLDVSPIDDIRSTADYRQTVVGNLVAELISA